MFKKKENNRLKKFEKFRLEFFIKSIYLPLFIKLSCMELNKYLFMIIPVTATNNLHCHHLLPLLGKNREAKPHFFTCSHQQRLRMRMTNFYSSSFYFFVNVFSCQRSSNNKKMCIYKNRKQQHRLKSK